MPQAASSISRDPYLRVLLMGTAKVGKSTSTILSMIKAFGPGYVVCCGDKSGMAPAARQSSKFLFDIIRDENDMEAALKEARRGVKDSEYKWIFVDDYSLFASWLEQALRDESARASKEGKADGRKFYPELKSRLINYVRRFQDIKAHLIFTTHFVSPSQEIDGQRAKAGQGIMPMIPGAAREEIPALFNDVLFMEKEKDKRVFQVNPEGVWGPGSRAADGTHTIEADFGVFWKLGNDAHKAAAGARR
jgi:hypothetical protein